MIALLRKLAYHHPRLALFSVTFLVLMIAVTVSEHSQPSLDPTPAPLPAFTQPTTQPQPTPQTTQPACEEDEPCWDPATMGNHRGHTSAPTQPTADPTPTSAQITLDVEPAAQAWPVETALAEWQLPATTFVRGSCDPHTTAACIRVVAQSDVLPVHKLGVTTRWQPGQALIQLNQVTPARDRLDVTAHELGHAFGLEHRQSKTDVLYPVEQPTHEVPSATEIQSARKNLGVS